MPWQLFVVDGADAKRAFPLPESGSVLIGNSHKHADICLHDLYVARVHCQIDVDEGKVVVTNLPNASGTFVNKVRVADKQVLGSGDVLRVGNSHLRLEPGVAAAPPKPPPGTPQPLPNLPGDRLHELEGHTLGHYELEEVLGRSPFKAVFRARDSRSDQTVTLKVLSPEFPAGQDELQNFIPAMRKALHLRHDNLVTLVGVGRTLPYTWVVREHVPGESLATVLERMAASGGGKPKWRHALRLALEIGAALDYVHRQGLYHGNLTPRNVLIRSADKQAKLANLMLDQALAGSVVAAHARPFKVAQDAPYLAPEQVEEGAFVDGLSDLYSLGAVVYARLTGKPPVQGKTTEDILQLVRAGAVTRPKRLNPTVPDEFDMVVMKMLQKHQEDRYANAAALLADLEPLAENAELTA